MTLLLRVFATTLALLSLSGAASAADDPAVDAPAATMTEPELPQTFLPDTHWQAVDRRAQRVHKGALLASGVGVVMVFVPVRNVPTAGAGLLLAAPPIMAASALRSTRALREQGSDLSPRMGRLSLGLYAGVYPAAALVLLGGRNVEDGGPAAVAAYLTGIVTLPSLYMGSYLLGLLQGRLNETERWGPATAGRQGVRRLPLALIPQVSRDQQGLVLLGSF